MQKTKKSDKKILNIFFLILLKNRNPIFLQNHFLQTNVCTYFISFVFLDGDWLYYLFWFGGSFRNNFWYTWSFIFFCTAQLLIFLFPLRLNMIIVPSPGIELSILVTKFTNQCFNPQGYCKVWELWHMHPPPPAILPTSLFFVCSLHNFLQM